MISIKYLIIYLKILKFYCIYTVFIYIYIFIYNINECDCYLDDTVHSEEQEDEVSIV